MCVCVLSRSLPDPTFNSDTSYLISTPPPTYCTDTQSGPSSSAPCFTCPLSSLILSLSSPPMIRTECVLPCVDMRR